MIRPETTNVPANCPRRTDDTSGPRSCPLLDCPLHLRRPADRGRGESRARIRAQLGLADTCSVDVTERARGAHEELTLEEIGILTGMSKQAAQHNLRNAVKKIRVRLAIQRFETKRNRFLTSGVRALLDDE